jgi:hypothetical protein
MSIQIIDNFDVRVAKPVDSRMIVGPTQVYVNREVVPNKYNGLIIWDENANAQYVWKGTTWSVTNDTLQVTHDFTNSSFQFLTFVSSTASGVYQFKSSGRIRYRSSVGQLSLSDGSANNPTLAFNGHTTTGTGFYKPTVNSIGVSINGVNRFQVGEENNSNARFHIYADPLNTNIGGGNFTIRRNGTNDPSFVTAEFFSRAVDPTFKIYASSPTAIRPTSFTTRLKTALTFTNYDTLSENNVRDRHLINTESIRGIIGLGNWHELGYDNEQFEFYMKGYDTSTAVEGSPPTSIFSRTGGGLRIRYNLKVDGDSWTKLTSRSANFRSDDGALATPAYSFSSVNNTGIYRYGNGLGFSSIGNLAARTTLVTPFTASSVWGVATNVINTNQVVYSRDSITTDTPLTKHVEGIFHKNGTCPGSTTTVVDIGDVQMPFSNLALIEYEILSRAGNIANGTWWLYDTKKSLHIINAQGGSPPTINTINLGDIPDGSIYSGATQQLDNNTSEFIATPLVQIVSGSSNYRARLRFRITYVNNTSIGRSYIVTAKYKVTTLFDFDINSSPALPPSPPVPPAPSP